MISLLVDLGLKQVRWTTQRALERNLVVHGICVLALVNLGGWFSFRNVRKLGHLAAFSVPLVLAIVSIRWYGEVELWLGSTDLPCLLILWYRWPCFGIWLVLTSHGFAISHHFPSMDSRSAYLVDSELTASVVIQALNQWDVKSFAFWFHEITVEQLDDTSNVLGPFISGKMDHKFEKLFIRVLLESNLLIEDELVVASGWHLGSDGVVIGLHVHLTWELYLHCDSNDIQVVLVNFNLLLVVGHLLCSFGELVLFIYDLGLFLKKKFLIFLL